MAKTASTMAMALGDSAPDFTLADYNAATAPGGVGGQISRDELRGPQGLLVMFICNHCPFVKAIRAELSSIGRRASELEIGVAAIMPNDVAGYPDDAPDRMTEESSDAGYGFAYLLDETQEVAKAYRAACTPDFFLFDGSLKLVYRGQLDDSRPGNGIAVSGSDLRAAMEAVAAERAVAGEQSPSIGCNIKWKPGNEPGYFSATS